MGRTLSVRLLGERPKGKGSARRNEGTLQELGNRLLPGVGWGGVLPMKPHPARGRGVGGVPGGTPGSTWRFRSGQASDRRDLSQHECQHEGELSAIVAILLMPCLVFCLRRILILTRHAWEVMNILMIAVTMDLQLQHSITVYYFPIPSTHLNKQKKRDLRPPSSPHHP